MTLPKLNPLALFACGIASWSVWSNRHHVMDAAWLIAAFVGAFVATAWLRDKTIGTWLIGASAALYGGLMMASGQVSEASRVMTSGASAGILAVMSVALVCKMFSR